ncbi:MAG TPA: 5'-nucleotidase C-terminal domain-containing protein, partial [Saprospiraceae bacterium]|nr:5'-nucleotidase C-terminal domain-containing protein [Saprospiraceae bacterium]
NFIWMGANARLKNPQGPSTAPMSAFYKNRPDGNQACPDHYVVSLKDADGTTLNLGVFGVLLNTGRKPWVEYSDPIQVAKQQYALLQPKTDVVVGLTHLAIQDDKKLAAALPNLPLMMGGHEHDNHYEKVGNVAIAKADANAKTVYIHTLRHDKNKRLTTLRSELRRVDSKIADEPNTAAVVAKWDKIMTESLGSLGLNPKAVVTMLREPLDCREVTLRFQQAPAGQMITKAMLFSGNDRLQAALLNSGSVRVDDVLAGTITELDVVRMLPFGGAVVEAQMRGSLLRRTLDVGIQNAGNGGYLQHGGIKPNPNGGWLIAGEPLDDNKTYWITLPEFLLSGNEQNMAFLKAAPSADGSGTTNPDILKINKPDPKN